MMYFEVNWVAVILATLASMVVGMGYYMTLGKQWMAALGMSEEEFKASSPNTVSPFIWAALSQVVIAYFIAMLTPQLMGVVDTFNAIVVGVHMWLGFIITAMIINHRYQGRKWSLTFIDGGYLMLVVIVQGLVIGLFS